MTVVAGVQDRAGGDEPIPYALGATG